MANKECTKCIHKEVCKTAETCDGYAPWCKHFNGWISVNERLPEEHDSMFAKLYGTKSWQPGISRKCSYDVIACVEREDGSKRVIAIRTIDGKWDWHKLQDGEQITHWMPLPEPPKGE